MIEYGKASQYDLGMPYTNGGNARQSATWHGRVGRLFCRLMEIL